MSSRENRLRTSGKLSPFASSKETTHVMRGLSAAQTAEKLLDDADVMMLTRCAGERVNRAETAAMFKILTRNRTEK